MQIDKNYKFIFAWFNSVETPLEMQTQLVCAEGLYCVAQFSFHEIGLTKEAYIKFVGLSSDGE